MKIIIFNNFQTLDFIASYNLFVFFLFVCSVSLPIQYLHFVAWAVKCLPTMWETWILSLGQEDPLEKEMATHSSIQAWKNPMDRGAW